MNKITPKLPKGDLRFPKGDLSNNQIEGFEQLL
jgi:hypothetical protein